MDEINRVYNEVKNFELVYNSYENKKEEASLIENEILCLQREEDEMNMIILQKEIAETELKYQNIFKAVDRYNLENSEYYTFKDIQTLYLNVDSADILQHKTLNYLETLIYPSFLSYYSLKSMLSINDYFPNADSSWLFTVVKISKEANDLFLFLVDHPTILKMCETNLYATLKKELEVNIPDDVRLFIDKQNLYIIFKSSGQAENDCFVKKELEYLELINLSELHGISELIYKLLKNNLGCAFIERQLTHEQVRSNNNCLSKSLHFINNVTEWELDVIMKEVIYISKKRVDEVQLLCVTKKSNNGEIIYSMKTRGEEEATEQDIACSNEYFRLIKCFELFKRIKSDRKGKATKLLQKAILKFFNPKRVSKTPRNYIILFSELSNFIKHNTEYTNLANLIRVKEELFFAITKESASIIMDINEDITRIKAYIKQKCYDFDELVLQVVPESSRLLFNLQFFEFLYKNLMKFLRSFKVLSTSQIANMRTIFEYANDLSFNVPRNSIVEYSRFKSYMVVLNSSILDVIRLHSDGSLPISDEEVEHLVLTLFNKTSIRDDFISSLR